MRALVPIALAITLGTACGSSHRLNARTTSVQSFASSQRCAQGPFEIIVPAEGHRWGGAIELRVSTPRRVTLRASAETVDRGTGLAAPPARLLGGRGTVPDNRRCVVSLREVTTTAGSDQLAPSGGGPGQPSGRSDRGDDGGGSGGAVPTLVSASAPAGGELLLRLNWRNPTLEPPMLRPGAKVRIRIWSHVPNDLEGVVFTVRQRIYVPSSGDAGFEAHLKRTRDKLRRRRQARAAARATSRPTSTRATRRRVVSHKDRRAARNKRQRDLLKRQRQKHRRARLRREYCAAHLGDRDCWGPGGFRVHVAMNARAAERKAYCRGHANDARCWSSSERYARRSGWRKRVAQQTQPPSGPPPAPRAETRSPAPSINAQWRPGYWHWTARWNWIAGQWRVPDTDLAGGLTTKAPRPPPPPKSESRPPPPAVQAIWVSGHWQWAGAAFVWVAGSWQLMPTAGARWQPARWKVHVGGVIFVPGRWTRGGIR